MTKTKIALAAVLFAATSSAAFAQFNPNTANYQGYATQGAAIQSAPVRLQNRTVVQPGDAAFSTGQSEFDADRFDRASSPYAGGN